jgi:hypothetical protein
MIPIACLSLPLFNLSTIQNLNFVTDVLRQFKVGIMNLNEYFRNSNNIIFLQIS